MQTKFHVMSDLHTELMSDSEVARFLSKLKTHAGGANDLILAGDIGNLAPRNQGRLLRFFHELSALYGNILYVPGNHEFWGTSIKEGRERLQDWEYAGLSRQVDVFEPWHQDSDGSGTTGGCTLWYPDCGDELQKRNWCDYAYISDAHLEIPKAHEQILSLEELPDVMITHHYPTTESIAPQWQGIPLNKFFCAYMEDWLATRKKLPKLWVHGHTHDRFDYVSKFGFRVYCNPYGYKDERANKDFWERLSVAVDL